MHERRTRRIVAKAARGDARAFGKLYDCYSARVFGFVRLRVWDERDAEELTESVFLKAYRALPGYEERSVPFSAWLFRIARNEVVDFTRRLARTVAVVEPDDEPIAEECVEEDVFARIEAAELRAAVQGLTGEQAEVIVARYFWGLSVMETAQAAGRTEGAVKALQHRAIRALQRSLQKDEAHEQAV